MAKTRSEEKKRPDARSFETLAAQAGVGSDRAYGAVSAPIYLSAIYRYDAFGKHRGYDYSRAPTNTIPKGFAGAACGRPFVLIRTSSLALAAW